MVLFMNRFGYLQAHCGSPADPLPTDPFPTGIHPREQGSSFWMGAKCFTPILYYTPQVFNPFRYNLARSVDFFPPKCSSLFSYPAVTAMARVASFSQRSRWVSRAPCYLLGGFCIHRPQTPVAACLAIDLRSRALAVPASPPFFLRLLDLGKYFFQEGVLLLISGSASSVPAPLKHWGLLQLEHGAEGSPAPLHSVLGRAAIFLPYRTRSSFTGARSMSAGRTSRCGC